MKKVFKKIFCLHYWWFKYQRPIGKGVSLRTYKCLKCGREKKRKYY